MPASLLRSAITRWPFARFRAGLAVGGPRRLRLEVASLQYKSLHMAWD
jgi:hypothetical protein